MQRHHGDEVGDGNHRIGKLKKGHWSSSNHKMTSHILPDFSSLHGILTRIFLLTENLDRGWRIAFSSQRIASIRRKHYIWCLQACSALDGEAASSGKPDLEPIHPPDHMRGIRAASHIWAAGRSRAPAMRHDFHLRSRE
jgi:hypothetical protein